METYGNPIEMNPGLFILFLTPLFLATSLRAAFRDIPWGARPAGMGGAFVAVADDSNAPLYNPGSTRLLSPEASFAYAKPFAGLSDVDLAMSLVSYVHPLSEKGAVSVAWAGLSAPQSSENTLLLTLAAPLQPWWEKAPADLSAGINLKYYHQKFELDSRTENDPVFLGGKSRGVPGFDLGIWFRPDLDSAPWLSLGAAGKDLNEPDIGLESGDIIRREFVLGAAAEIERWIFSMETLRKQRDLAWRAGMEIWLFKELIALRSGVNSTDFTVGFSYRHSFSSHFSSRLDYAFLFPRYLEDTSGTHRVGLAVEF